MGEGSASRPASSLVVVIVVIVVAFSVPLAVALAVILSAAKDPSWFPHPGSPSIDPTVHTVHAGC
jgi:flagellar basal body-associated protein FliL